MKFLPALFIFFFYSSFAQDDNEISFISFELTHSLRIPNHHVFINIINKNKQPCVHLISTPSTRIRRRIFKATDSTFLIGIDTFKQLSADVLKLNNIDVVKANLDGRDGTTCKIEYGSADKVVKYEFWSPDFETEQRGLTNFLNACKKIIDAEYLRPKDVL